MTERFYPPFQRFFTTDLKTLPGALLYFYENGTTTPKTVYRDPFKNNAHANPVVAGTHGAAADTFPAIFLDGTYTIELRSSAGVVQSGWPVDNVGGEQVEGQFDTWSAIVSYAIGDIVTGSNGLVYVSEQNNNLNRDPTVTANVPTYWTVLRLSLEWDVLTPFQSGDRVFYNGAMYVSLQNSNVGNTPSSNSAWWKKIKEYEVWNNATTYPSGVYVFDGEERYVSVQGFNLNHQPSADTTYTWWKPDWQAIPSLTTVNTVSGGGLLKAYFDNVITDGNSGYLLPLANTVPNKGYIVISKSDIARVMTPTVTRSGSDTIAYLGGTDTSFIIDTLWADTMILYSNGINQWSF